MNEKTFQALEFERILSGVRSFCINADGKEQTQLLMPQSDYTEAKRLLAETEEAFKILFQYTKEPIFVYVRWILYWIRPLYFLFLRPVKF